MIPSRLCSLVALALAVSAAAAGAQVPDTVPLSPIVVTATRMPAPVSNQPNAVSVLSGDDLRRAGITTVSDAVRVLAGAAVVQGGSFGSVTSLFLRGGQSDYVRVLVDGVPVNAPGGALNLANLTTLNVERIELVRGPSSVLYGSDAVTGVMQIFTRRPSGPAASAAVRAGTYGSTELLAELSGGTARAGASLAAAQSNTSGLYDFNNHYRNTQLSGDLHAAPDARSSLQLNGRYGTSRFNYPTDGAGNQNDSNSFADSRTVTLSLDAGRIVLPRLEARMLVGYNEARTRTNDAQDNAADTNGVYAFHSTTLVRRTGADARINARLGGASVLTVGAALESETWSDTNDYQSSFGPGGGSSSGRRTNRAGYAQLVSGWGDRFWIQAGARLDDNTVFGAFGTWRFGATATLTRTTRLRANIGVAFKEPTFDATVSTGFTVGDPNLRPERTRSWEAGIEQAIGGARGRIALSYFDQRFRDMIQYAYVSPYAPNYFNIAAARASGLEVEGRFAVSRAVRVHGQYTWLHTAVDDPGYDSSLFAPGRPLVRRPQHSAAIEMLFEPVSRVSAGVRTLVVGRREDLDFNQFPAARVVLPAYTRVDLWTEVAVLQARATALAVTARVDNLFGAGYTEVFGFRSPGRMLRIGLRMDARR